MKSITLLCALALLAHAAAGTTESKTFTISTPDGPMTVTETKVTEEVTTDKVGWSSSSSSGGASSASEAGGSILLAVDRSALAKGIEKFIQSAIKKLPLATTGMKVGFVVYGETASTLVSLKQGWSLDQVMERLQREIASGAKSGGRVLDYVGLQAAYNELKANGKATAPRIVLLLSSGRDADKAKSTEWRKKLMAEWISISEVHVDSSISEGSTVTVETTTEKLLPVSTLLTTLIKSYSAARIQHVKDLYGEMWEFYIVLKYYKKAFPRTWRAQTETWFKTRYGNLTKFNIYLKRINKNLDWYQKRYGSNWRWFYKRYIYRRRYGASWRTHFDNWVKTSWKRPVPGLPISIQARILYFKKKFGVNWVWYYKRYVYRRRYGLRWRVHFDRWVKTTWKKPAPALPAFIVRRIAYYKKKFGVNWEWFYKRYVYRRRFGLRWRVYFDLWVKTTWKKPAPALPAFIVRRIAYYKKKFGVNWEWFYKRYVYRRRFGLRWRVYFARWVKIVWKKPAPALPAFVVRRINWFKSRFGVNWRYFYIRVLYRRLYGRRWRARFSKWVRLVWKKPAPAHISLIRRTIAWFKERYGDNWSWFYTRILYRRRYGYRWRIYFSRWVKTVWKKPTPSPRYYVVYRRSATGPWLIMA